MHPSSTNRRRNRAPLHPPLNAGQTAGVTKPGLEAAPAGATICCLLDYFSPGVRAGGPIRSIENMARALAGHARFHIITRDRDHSTAPYATVVSDAWNKMPLADVYYASPKARSPWRMIKLLRSMSFDVMYVNSAMSRQFSLVPLIAMRLGLVPRRPIVFAARGEFNAAALGMKKHRKAAYLWLFRRLFRSMPMRFQAANEPEQRDIQAAIPWAEIVMLPPLVAMPEGKGLGPNGKKTGKLRMGFIARISRMKNLIGTVEGMQHCTQEVQFKVFGPLEEQGYWDECMAAAKDLPAKASVSHQGVLERAAIPKALSEMDVLIQYSHGESFGHSVAEALAAGVPVIASDQMPWGDMEERRAGVTVPLGQPEALAAAIDRFARMTPEEMQEWRRGAEAYANALAESSRRMVATHRELFSASGWSTSPTAQPASRVLCLLDYFSPGVRAVGPTRSVENIVRSLGNNARFRIVTRDRDHSSEPYAKIESDRWTTRAGTEVYYASPRGRRPLEMIHLLRSPDYDVLYLNSVMSRTFSILPLMAMWLRLVPRRPVVLATRGEFNPAALGFKPRRKAAYLRLFRTLFRNLPIRFQAESEAEKRDIQSALPWAKDVQLLPPPLGAPSASIGASDKVRGTIRLGFIGRISRMKNLRGSIEAMRDCTATVVFTVYGPQEEMDYWEECIAAAEGLSSKVEVNYGGVLQREEIPAALSRMDVLIQYSHGESYGHSVAEALAAGVPVIASDQMPWAALEGKRAGVTVPHNQPRLLASTIDRFASMDAAELQQWRAGALEFSRELAAASRHLLETYRELFSPQRPAN